MTDVVDRIQKKIVELFLVAIAGGLTVYATVYPQKSIAAAGQSVIASLLAAAVFFTVYLYGPFSIIIEMAAAKLTKSALIRSVISGLFFFLYAFLILFWQRAHPENFAVAVIVSASMVFVASLFWERRLRGR